VQRPKERWPRVIVMSDWIIQFTLHFPGTEKDQNSVTLS